MATFGASTTNTANLADNAVTDAKIAAHTTTKITSPLANLANSGGATGDMAIWNGTNWVRLAVPTAGQRLGLSAGTLAWLAGPGLATIASKAAQESTSTTPIDVASMSFSVAASTGYFFCFMLRSNAGANWHQVAITFPSGGTLGALAMGSSQTIYMQTSGTFTANLTQTDAMIIGSFNNGGTAGTLQLRIQMNAGTGTVDTGCRLVYI